MHFFRFLLFLPYFGLLETSVAQCIPYKLDSALNRTLKIRRLSLGTRSLSAAIQFSDNTTWSSTDGVSSTAPLDFATPEHSYGIGSITKSITAACVLQLADEGKLNLDDSLHEWLPTFPYVNPNITIRQLLRHQSGLYDVITNPAYNTANNTKLDSVWSLSNLVRDYIKPPLFEPGTDWSYSNTNYALLGLIVEAVTGNTYHAEYKKRFFAPLNLSSLVLPPYDPYPAKVAHAWLDTNGDGSTEDIHSFFSKWRSFTTSAGPIGGYYGTPKDIAIWNRAFLRGDLHSQKIMNEAKTTVTTTMPVGGRYGLGIMERKFLGLAAYGHGGDIVYSTSSYYFPSKDISITVFNNDALKNSWALAPVVEALLKVYLNCEASVSADNSLDLTELNASVYPNPFSTGLNISFSLSTDIKTVEVVVTNVMGSEISRTNAGRRSAGPQNIAVPSLEHLSTGMYFAHIVLDGKTAQTLKLTK